MRQVLIAFALAAGAVGSSPAGSAEQPRTGAAPPAPQAAAPASPAASPTLLRRLPPSPRGSRLWGEQASVAAPVYVTRRQAEANVRFRIGSLSSVSVLPESGTLTIAVNGTRIRDVPLGAAYGLRLTEFDIPAGLLKEGWNSVGISAHHRHRVDCSVDAAEELWTRVDPAETGFLFPDGTARIADLSDIAAISPRPDGAVPIAIVLDPKHLLSGDNVERLGRAVQGIALAGRFAQPIVEFDSTGDAGLDLVVGKVGEVAGRIDQASMDKITGPTIALVPGAERRRPTIVITGQSDADLDLAIAQLGMVSALGTPDGLKTLAGASGHPIDAYGQTLTFSDLGIETQELIGGTLRVGFNAALPNDFLPADYDRVALDFSGGYAPGLGADTQIIVEVNGQSAGSIRLGAPAGDSFRHKRHFLPLTAFRPGQNRIELRVNAPNGKGCDTSAVATATPRVWLNGASKVTFPAVARVGRVPDLAMMSSGAFPFAATAGKMILVVPTPDRDTLGAALTIMARLGVAAGAQIPFAYAASVPAGAPGNVLVVAPARALDPANMREARLDPDLVRDAWSAAAEISPSRTPVSRSVLRRRAYEGDWPETCAIDRQIPQDPQDGVDMALADVTGSVRTGLGSAHIGRMFEAARRLIGSDPGPTPETRAEAKDRLSGASLLVAQGLRAGMADSVITIVSSPNAATLGNSITCLVEPSVWSHLAGGLSVLDASTGAVSVTAAESTHYVATQEFSTHNERLMFAGWLSLNPRFFILFAFLLTVPLAVTTHFLVRNVGRKNL
jgi:cellulose synthase operon protein B